MEHERYVKLRILKGSVLDIFMTFNFFQVRNLLIIFFDNDMEFFKFLVVSISPRSRIQQRCHVKKAFWKHSNLHERKNENGTTVLLQLGHLIMASFPGLRQ